MPEVIVNIGNQAVYATVTSGPAGRMNMKEGDDVFTMFNTTSVSVIEDQFIFYIFRQGT